MVLSIHARLLAGEPAELKAKIDALAQPLVDGGPVVGLAIGVIDGGKTHVFGYGRTSRDGDETPDERTVFEIGSVTKVFTGLLLADMVQHRLVELEDPVGKFLPESVTVPQSDGRAITLLDLATHSSGLPRLPDNFAASASGNPKNPYAEYSVDHLYAFLSKHTLSRRPGTRYLYSNLGMGLLGHALARRADTSYQKLVVERICLPLGMKDTRIGLPEALRRRLAPGHDAAGNPVPNWDIPTLAGAGALRSTVHDLLLFLSANLGLRRCPLADAIRSSHRPRRAAGNPNGKIALGWQIKVKEAVYWHNGGTGGYHSLVAFQKQRKIGVVVLGNSAADAVDELGFRLMQLPSGQPDSRQERGNGQ